jgi:cytochrome c
MTGATAFPYSKSMKAIGFVWSPKHLFVYLKNPSKYVVGTRMAFAGLESE